MNSNNNSSNCSNNNKNESDHTFWLEEEWTCFSSGMDHKNIPNISNKNPLDIFASNEFKMETNGIAEENNCEVLFDNVDEQYQRESKSVKNSHFHELHLGNATMDHLHKEVCEEEIKLNLLKDPPLWVDCPNVSSIPVFELGVPKESIKQSFYENKEKKKKEHIDLWMTNHAQIEIGRECSINHQSRENNILIKQISNQSKEKNKRKTRRIKCEEKEKEEEKEEKEEKEEEEEEKEKEEEEKEKEKEEEEKEKEKEEKEEKEKEKEKEEEKEGNRKWSFIKMSNEHSDYLQFSDETSNDYFHRNSCNEYIKNHQRKEGNHLDGKSSDSSIHASKEDTKKKEKSKVNWPNGKKKEEEHINEYIYPKESIESIKKFIEQEKKIKMKKKKSNCSSRKCSNDSYTSLRTMQTEEGDEQYNRSNKIEKEKRKKKTKRENEKRKFLEGVISSDENLFKEKMSSNEFFFDELKSYLYKKQSVNDSNETKRAGTHENKELDELKKKELSAKEEHDLHFNNSYEMLHLEEINNSNLIDRKKESSSSSNINSKRTHEKNDTNQNQMFQEIETSEINNWENKKRICKTLEDIEGNIKNHFNQIEDGSNKSSVINKKGEQEKKNEKCTDYKKEDATSFFTTNNFNNSHNQLRISKEMNDEISQNTNSKYIQGSTLHSSDNGTLVEGISDEEYSKGDTEGKSVEATLFTREENLKKNQNKQVHSQSNINTEKTKEIEKQVSQKPRKFRDIFISFIKREESSKQGKKDSLGRLNTDLIKKMNKKEIIGSKEMKNLESIEQNCKNIEKANIEMVNNSEKQDEKEKQEKFNNYKDHANFKIKLDHSSNEKNNEMTVNVHMGIKNNTDQKNNKKNELLSKSEKKLDYGLESNSLLNETSQNIYQDPVGQKKKPNTLYNNFLESLKDSSCKEVVDKVKYFILNFPQHLNREQASSRIHTFISETQPLLLNSSIYKNATPYQVTTIQEGYEKFIIQKLFFYLFQMDPLDKDEDEKMYTKINCLQWIQFEHLEIPDDIDIDHLKMAQKELQRMQKMKAPKDKLIMILNCCRIVTTVLYEAKKQRKKMKNENKKKAKKEEMKKEAEEQKEKEREREEKEHVKKKKKGNVEENASIEEEKEKEEKENEEEEEEEINKIDVINKYIKNIVEKNQLQVNKKRSDYGKTEEIETEKESMIHTSSINTNWSNSNNISNQIKMNSNTYSSSNNNNNNNNIDLNSNGSFVISKKYLNEDIALESDDEILPCADEILPLLIYVIIKANPEGLISNILFIQYFRHPNHFVSEEAYSFTQFCSAVEFIKQLGKTTFLNIEEEEYRNKMNEAEQLYLYEVKESHKKLQESARKLNALVKNSNGKHTYTNILHKIESLQLNFEQTKDFNSLTVANIPLLFEEYHKLINMKNDILKDIYDQFNETPTIK